MSRFDACAYYLGKLEKVHWSLLDCETDKSIDLSAVVKPSFDSHWQM